MKTRKSVTKGISEIMRSRRLQMLLNGIVMVACWGLAALDFSHSAVGQEAAGPASAAEDGQAVLKRMGNRGIMVHDPSTIVRCKDEYWVFITGRNTPSFHCKDLVNWTSGPRANANPPAWVA